jgi:hypothetical protein
MAYSTIDVGGNDTNISIGGTGYTFIDKNNPANANGVLTSFRVGLSGTSNIIMGTFSVSGTTLTNRDHEDISSASSGTYTGRNCDVATYDLLGIWAGTTQIHYAFSGDGEWYIASNIFGTSGTCEAYGPLIFNMYATGVTVPDAPTSVSATDNLTDKVTITWTAGTGETDGNKVYRDGTVLNSDVAIAHDTNTFDDTTGTAGTTYAYTVKAINPAGLSAASTADNGTRVASTSIRQVIWF